MNNIKMIKEIEKEVLAGKLTAQQGLEKIIAKLQEKIDRGEE